MRHILRNSIFVVALMVLMVAAIVPPDKTLRLGKDLRGGVTLVYAVQVDRSVNAADALSKTIEVLKNRVDPNGLFEIQMVAQGQDRIEISMPLPGPRVEELKAAFEATLEALNEQTIDPGDLDRTMRLAESERAPELDRIAGGNAVRAELLRSAAEAIDSARGYRVLLEDAQRRGLDQSVIDDLAGQAAEAELEYETLRAQVLESSLSPDTLRRALDLPRNQKTIEQSDETFIRLDSQYTRELNRLKTEHPDLTDEIDAAVEAYEVYRSDRRSLDDSADLKRLLAGSGVLEFHIACDAAGSADTAMVHPEEARLRKELQEKGPRNVRSRDARWYRIDQIDNFYDSQDDLDALDANPVGYFRSKYRYAVEPYEGSFYMLLWDQRGLRITQAEGRWGLERSTRTTDQLGRPAIGFRMDARGARLLGDLTGTNTGNFMAVVLDGEVITAPNINSRITRDGVIEGEFPEEELNYIIQVLNAGSLQARLSAEPLSEIRVAPDLGQDNLDAGLQAGIAALIVVSIFMILYYFGFGVVAVFCLFFNALLILGAMALARASFTLPGIAGVILTFGMAVDANVLIYERVREELRKGMDLRVAVKLGFEKALSSIVDGNVTNLIVCFVLAYTGTQEIKGFAITLGIGVVATLFSALVVNRLIFTIFVDHIKIRKMAMLPMVFTPIERLLEPKIQWLNLRWIFAVFSLVYVSVGIGMIATRGEKMLDTEFRGGTQVELLLKPVDATDPDGGRITLTRPEVEARIHAIGDGLGEGEALRPLRAADVLAVDAQADGVTSSKFIVKTYATDSGAVLSSIIEEFAVEIDALPALRFDRSLELDPLAAPVFALTSSQLGDNVGQPGLLEDVGDYLGGAAIMLEGIEPATTLAQLEQRLEQMRSKPDFSSTLQRRSEVRVIAGSADAVESAVILVLDDGLSIFDNEEAWRIDVAAKEWRLAREALTAPVTLASVQTFSPVIAETFKAQAVVAVLLSLLLILIYIWVRFGSVRYSMAAILTLTHDVLTAVGLIALAEIVHDSEQLGSVATTLGIEPFKIDLNMIAALLTIIGYSLNDTIIIMDRIRENRGRLPYASARIINDSINQTISRTVITSGTTLLAVLILYVYGGQGVRSFSYTLLIGVVVGTYSSIAVAAPLVWSRRGTSDAKAVAGEPGSG